jgi:hypothetical protein
VLTANMLGQMSYGHGPISSLFSSLMDGSFGTRETIWAVCAAARASERNIRLAIGACLPGSDHRKGIQTGVYVSAAEAVAYTACGFSYAWVAGGTGLEARVIGEVLRVTAGMHKSKADGLVNAIMEKVDSMVGKEPPMVPFTEKYDVKTVKPLPEYETKVMQVKEDLARMGIPFA